MEKQKNCAYGNLTSPAFCADIVLFCFKKNKEKRWKKILFKYDRRAQKTSPEQNTDRSTYGQIHGQVIYPPPTPHPDPPHTHTLLLGI